MDHETALITTVVAGLVLAFIFGLIAHKLKLSPLVGYLLAGIVCGPYTPGLVTDVAMAQQMAEIGIILLMFGVGMHFSLRDLLAVRNIALPGALVQMAVATLLGYGLGCLAGFNVVESLIFGFSLSTASTVVLLRALEDRNELDSKAGKIAIGWLIVEDIAMVLALVIIPPLLQTDGDASLYTLATSFLITLVKIAAFVVLIIVAGTRLLPPLLTSIAKDPGGELFTLAVIAVALGVAYIAYHWFGASFALGAFLAGLVLGNSDISKKVAKRSLPLRDIFAVLFFVSVGMLFDPEIILTQPLLVLGVVAVIMVGKSLAALLITKLFGQSLRTGLTIAASLAQIGEFSFILAAMGIKYEVLSGTGSDLILAGALLSIALNPFVFLLAERLKPDPVPARI
ncbi:MAG: Kef family transporter [Micavibrio sp.]|nr:Kef family transporter [Micavibrio sp.]